MKIPTQKARISSDRKQIIFTFNTGFSIYLDEDQKDHKHNVSNIKLIIDTKRKIPLTDKTSTKEAKV